MMEWWRHGALLLSSNCVVQWCLKTNQFGMGIRTFSTISKTCNSLISNAPLLHHSTSMGSLWKGDMNALRIPHPSYRLYVVVVFNSRRVPGANADGQPPAASISMKPSGSL